MVLSVNKRIKYNEYLKAVNVYANFKNIQMTIEKIYKDYFNNRYKSIYRMKKQTNPNSNCYIDSC